VTGLPGQKTQITTEEVRLDEGKSSGFPRLAQPTGWFDRLRRMRCKIYRCPESPMA